MGCPISRSFFARCGRPRHSTDRFKPQSSLVLAPRSDSSGSSTTTNLQAVPPTPLHRIGVYILEFLHPLSPGVHVEIIVACLPERPLFGSLPHRNLQRLQAHGKQFSGRLPQQQMHMFRHHHVAKDVEMIAAMYRFQRIFKQISRNRSIKIREPVVATERYEV